MKNQILLFAVICCFSISGCTIQPSDAVDQAKIWTGYELFYDKNENKTYAKAIFKFGDALGTTLQLSSSSEVRFNNEVLPFNSTTGFYERPYNGFIKTGTFTFRDTRGTTYTNTVAEIVEIDFPAGNLLTMKRGTDYRLSWVGTPLTANENIGVLLGTTPFLQIVNGSTSITLGGVQLNNFNAGAYVAIMDRSRLIINLQAPTAGGAITSKYRTTNKAVQIEN